MKLWRSNILLDCDLFVNFSVWVRVPNLQVQYWPELVLNMALSVTRMPMFIDDTTTNLDNIDYAKCCAEVSTTKVLLLTVKLYLPMSETVEQRVVYEWLLPQCINCLSFGHLEVACPVCQDLGHRGEGFYGGSGPACFSGERPMPSVAPSGGMQISAC